MKGIARKLWVEYYENENGNEKGIEIVVEFMIFHREVGKSGHKPRGTLQRGE